MKFEEIIIKQLISFYFFFGACTSKCLLTFSTWFVLIQCLPKWCFVTNLGLCYSSWISHKSLYYRPVRILFTNQPSIGADNNSSRKEQSGSFFSFFLSPSLFSSFSHSLSSLLSLSLSSLLLSRKMQHSFILLGSFFPSVAWASISRLQST